MISRKEGKTKKTMGHDIELQSQQPPGPGHKSREFDCMVAASFQDPGRSRMEGWPKRAGLGFHDKAWAAVKAACQMCATEPTKQMLAAAQQRKSAAGPWDSLPPHPAHSAFNKLMHRTPTYQSDQMPKRRLRGIFAQVSATSEIGNASKCLLPLSLARSPPLSSWGWLQCDGLAFGLVRLEPGNRATNGSDGSLFVLSTEPGTT